MLHFLLILEILLCQQYLLVQNNEKQAGAELVHPQLAQTETGTDKVFKQP